MPAEAPVGRPLVGSSDSDPAAETAPLSTGTAPDPELAGAEPEAVEDLPPVKPGTTPATSTEVDPHSGATYWSPASSAALNPKDPNASGEASTAPPDSADPSSDSSSHAAEAGYPVYPSGVTEGSGAGEGTVTPDSGTVPVAAPAPVPRRSPGVSRAGAQAEEEEEEEEEEEGGGPVKPFLDHLEDLRWMLIKVISSVALGMLVCLVASDKLVSFLMWPLKHSQRMLPVANRRVPLLMGTNQIAKLTPASVGFASTDSNRVTGLQLKPLWTGSNYVVSLQVQTNTIPGGNDPEMVVLKNYGPISAFMVALKLALYGGLVLSAPFVIFFIGQFVLPALKVKEKAFLYRVAGFGSLLFIAGIMFCYFLIVQVALMASVQFSQWMGFGADEWRAEDYVSFVSKFMLGMGLSFQLPLVILTMVKIGIIDHETLVKYRAYFIVGNLIVSAVVTPSGDPLTMVLMALPLQFLYEASVVISRYWAKKDRVREAAEG